MKSVWKFPLTGIPQEIRAPGLRLPCFAANQASLSTICVWAEVCEGEPERRCIVTVHGTGHPIGSDEHYVGTVMDGEFVWHYYATTPA